MRSYIHKGKVSHGNVNTHVKKLSLKQYRKLQYKDATYDNCFCCSQKNLTPPKLVIVEIPLHEKGYNTSNTRAFVLCPDCYKYKSTFVKATSWGLL